MIPAVRFIGNGRKARGGSTTPPPPPPPPPPSGGSYVDFNGVINVSGSSSNQVIEGFRFTGGGFNDNRIAIRLVNCTGEIIIKRNYISGFTGLDSRAIYIQNCKKVIIEDNFCEFNTTDCQVWNSNLDYCTFRRNKSLDLYGNLEEGSYGGLTSHFQMVGCISDNILITDNRIQQNDGKAHDIFNFFSTEGTPAGRILIQDNWARGRVLSRDANGVITTSNCGNRWGRGGAFIVCGDDGGKYIDVIRNIMVNATMFGIQVVKEGVSSNIRLYDNIILIEKRNELRLNRRTGLYTLSQGSISYQVDPGALEDMERNVGITYRWRDEAQPNIWIRNDVYPGVPGISNKPSNLYGAAAEATGLYNPDTIIPLNIV